MAKQSESLEPMTFDTRDLPEAAAFPTFASAIENFTVTQRSPKPFDVRAQIWRIGALVLTHARVDPVRYDRPVARVRADAVDHIVATYLLKGSYRVDCGDGSVKATPGSLSVADLRQPFWSEDDRLELVSISMPRASILPRLGEAEVHGLMARDGLVPLLGGMIRALLVALPSTPLARANLVERMLVDLIAETLSEALRGQVETRARADALVSRARLYIDRHLDHALDVDKICAALGVSRSAIYRAFGDGGVQRQVLLRRLRHARTLLADPLETRSIVAIAEAAGFADKSHFNKAFKREYGEVPSLFRARGGQALVEADPGATPGAFRSWTRQLS